MKNTKNTTMLTKKDILEILEESGFDLGEKENTKNSKVARCSAR